MAAADEMAGAFAVVDAGSGIVVSLSLIHISSECDPVRYQLESGARAARDAAGDGVADHPGAGAWKALPCAGRGAALHLCRILHSAVYNVKPRKSTKSKLFSVDRRWQDPLL